MKMRIIAALTIFSAILISSQSALSHPVYRVDNVGGWWIENNHSAQMTCRFTRSDGYWFDYHLHGYGYSPYMTGVWEYKCWH